MLKTDLKRFTLEALRTAIVDLDQFYQPIESLLLGIKCMYKHQKLQILGPKYE